jgi:preprotein translocase subunit SecD
MHLPRWRLIAVVVVTLLGIVFALPNVLPASVRNSIPAPLPSGTINLGLDLQGGSHLLLEVDAVALERERLDNFLEDMKNELTRPSSDTAERIAVASQTVEGTTARLQLLDPAKVADALERVRALDRPQAGLTGGGGVSMFTFASTPEGAITAAMTEDSRKAEVTRAVAQSIEILRRRIDPNGTSEVTIVPQGAGRIIVQAPGETDPEQLKARIGQTAKLTFQMVDESVSPEEIAQGRPPRPGTVVLPYATSQAVEVVQRRSVVTGEDLTDARQTTDQTGAAVVSFRFNASGARAFGRVTEQNTGKRFAIVLDGKVISAPVINEPILGGSGQISGNFTFESANELALLLRSGALPAPLNVIEQRSVGAELGADAVQAGGFAGVAAGLCVLAFMLLAYGFLFGGISVVALVVNFILIIASMTAVNAALTLPGIAGLILTLAMAVDANVLIYERMRDEEAAGKGAAFAADAGFQRAFTTILDANITTILAAVILFIFGIGPVRGFAWTLTIGCITTVFTAVLITQVLLSFWFRSSKPKKLPI